MNCESGRSKLFGLQYSIQYTVEGSEESGRGQPGRYLSSNLIQYSQSTVIRLKVYEEQWGIAQGSKRQAGGYGSHVRNLSQGYGTQMLYTTTVLYSSCTVKNTHGPRVGPEKKTETNNGGASDRQENGKRMPGTSIRSIEHNPPSNSSYDYDCAGGYAVIICCAGGGKIKYSNNCPFAGGALEMMWSSDN